MIDDKTIEAVAKAIVRAGENQRADMTDFEYERYFWFCYIDEAKAAIQAYESCRSMGVSGHVAAPESGQPSPERRGSLSNKENKTGTEAPTSESARGDREPKRGFDEEVTIGYLLGLLDDASKRDGLLQWIGGLRVIRKHCRIFPK